MLGGLIVLGIIGWNVGSNVVETISPCCYSQIDKCKDNADVVNHYGRMSKAKAACVSMANGMAKFGTPLRVAGSGLLASSGLHAPGVRVGPH